MVTTLLIITLVLAILALVCRVLSYIFDVVDDFHPFTSVWYNASGACGTIAEFSFTGSVMFMVIASIVNLIGG